MPMYEVVTPLRNGGQTPVPPGEIVQLSAIEGDALVSIGALTPRPDVAETDPVATGKPLGRQSKSELLAAAQVEGVEVTEAMTNAAIVEAISAKRTASGGSPS